MAGLPYRADASGSLAYPVRWLDRVEGRVRCHLALPSQQASRVGSWTSAYIAASVPWPGDRLGYCAWALSCGTTMYVCSVADRRRVGEVGEGAREDAPAVRRSRLPRIEQSTSPTPTARSRCQIGLSYTDCGARMLYRQVTGGVLLRPTRKPALDLETCKDRASPSAGCGPHATGRGASSGGDFSTSRASLGLLPGTVFFWRGRTLSLDSDEFFDRRICGATEFQVICQH